jgi:hypothetical protein
MVSTCGFIAIDGEWDTMFLGEAGFRLSPTDFISSWSKMCSLFLIICAESACIGKPKSQIPDTLLTPGFANSLLPSLFNFQLHAEFEFAAVCFAVRTTYH